MTISKPIQIGKSVRSCQCPMPVLIASKISTTTSDLFFSVKNGFHFMPNVPITKSLRRNLLLWNEPLQKVAMERESSSHLQLGMNIGMERQLTWRLVSIIEVMLVRLVGKDSRLPFLLLHFSTCRGGLTVDTPFLLVLWAKI